MKSQLCTLESPHMLRTLARNDLRDLAAELRAFVLESVSATGGHLASNLGVVELTIALHYAFETPRDLLVWDVGHQCYPHKILTGRRDAMHTLRQMGGISGFPRREESEHDTFGTAHSSTAISAMLGMAQASRLKGEDRHCVAIVGDGAMSAGIAFEALNNAGACDKLRTIVVLNDNDMSISPPVGALRKLLLQLAAPHRLFAEARNLLARGIAASAGGLAARGESLCLGGGHPGKAGFFEDLGFRYRGPVDGHDLDALLDALESVKSGNGPQLLHVITRKGQGYAPAEADPVLYHGPGKFNPAVGIVAQSKPAPRTYAQVFCQWLCEAAESDKRVVAITPAMREGSGLNDFERRFPDRYFDVGIAEQHALTFAAGLATQGLRPVVAIYSTFLQRAYDQLIHDIAIQRLPVVLAIDRAGIVGADGATHSGAFDIAYLRCVPHLVVMAPSDENECRRMLHTALLHDGPAAVRYPRGHGPGAAADPMPRRIRIGKAQVKRRALTAHAGARIAILAFGPMLAPALIVGERLDATVVNMRFVKPLDHDLIRRLASMHDVLVTVEEGCIAGGAGTACLESLAMQQMTLPVLQLGFSDQFIEHGDSAKLLTASGLDADGIECSVLRFVARLRRAAKAAGPRPASAPPAGDVNHRGLAAGAAQLGEL